MMKAKVVQLSLLLSLFLIAPISYSKSNESVTFQSWSVVCGDDNFCTATTPDQSNAAGALKVRRYNDEKANWEISVQTKADNPSQFGPLSLRIAGQRRNTLKANRDYASFSNANEFFLINTSALNLLFRRMIESRRVFVVFGAKNQQKINASYSLNGLSNALLWIDEEQNRVGSRRTVGPPIERSTEKPKSVQHDAETIATNLHRKTLDPSLCDVSAEQTYRIGVTVEALDEATSLVMIPCFAAASNTSFRVFLVDKESQTATLQLWATYSAFTGWVGTDILSNVSYDIVSKELTMLHKGRGHGDCGIRGKWGWKSDGRFEMIEFSAKDDCDGVDNDWPIIFPAPKVIP
ncbi:MAG: DUF1176 domain-containing protein [Hyphomicrobiales bacterium]